MVYLDTGSFTFYSGNASQYTFEYQLNNAPSGVSLTDYTHSNDLDYTYRYVNVDSTVTDGATFSLSVTAYAVGYESEAISSNTLSFTIYNPNTATWREEFPGLTSFEVTIDGQNEFIPLLKGDHALAAKTVPENYCEMTGTTVTFLMTLTPAEGWPTLQASTLTVPDSNILYCNDTPLAGLACTIASPLTGKSVQIDIPYYVTTGDDANPNSYYDYSSNFFLRYGKQRGGFFKPGSYPLQFVFDAYNHSDRSGYTLKMLPNVNLVEGITFSEPTWDGGVVMTIAEGAKLLNTSADLLAAYYLPSDPSKYTRSHVFYLALA